MATMIERRFIIVFFLLNYTLLVFGFHTSFRNSSIKSKYSTILYNNNVNTNDNTNESKTALTTQQIEKERWSNPNYEKSQLSSWFNLLNKSLLTIGLKGVSPSQINSLVDLLKSHERVRIKIASDRLDIKLISQEVINNPALCDNTELLEVRQREFMIGRKQTQPLITTKK